MLSAREIAIWLRWTLILVVAYLLVPTAVRVAGKGFSFVHHYIATQNWSVDISWYGVVPLLLVVTFLLAVAPRMVGRARRDAWSQVRSDRRGHHTENQVQNFNQRHWEKVASSIALPLLWGICIGIGSGVHGAHPYLMWSVLVLCFLTVFLGEVFVHLHSFAYLILGAIFFMNPFELWWIAGMHVAGTAGTQAMKWGLIFLLRSELPGKVYRWLSAEDKVVATT